MNEMIINIIRKDQINSFIEKHDLKREFLKMKIDALTDMCDSLDVYRTEYMLKEFDDVNKRIAKEVELINEAEVDCIDVKDMISFWKLEMEKGKYIELMNRINNYIL